MLIEVLQDYLENQVLPVLHHSPIYKNPNTPKAYNQSLNLFFKAGENITIQNSFEQTASILKRHFQNMAAVKTQHLSISVDFKSGLFIEVYPSLLLANSTHDFQVNLKSKRNPKILQLHLDGTRNEEPSYFPNFRKLQALFTIWNGQQKAGIRPYLLELILGRAILNLRSQPDDLWETIEAVFEYGQKHLNAMLVLDPAFPKNKNFNKYPLEKKANISGRLRNTISKINEQNRLVSTYFKTYS